MQKNSDMDMGGMTLGMKMSADMQIKKISDTESEMAMVMNTSILGQEVVIEEYFKDGYLYMNDGAGTKVKAPFEYSEIAGQATMNTATSRDFMDKLEDLINFTLPQYVEEGKTELVIAVGCTGGRHRSVAVASELAAFITKRGYTVVLDHRDMNRR